MSSLFAKLGAGLHETGASGTELKQNHQLEDEQSVVLYIEPIGSRSSQSHENNDFVQCNLAKYILEDTPEADRASVYILLLSYRPPSCPSLLQIVCCEHCLALVLIFGSAKAFSSAISNSLLKTWKWGILVARPLPL